MRHLGRDILKFAAENENIVPTLWPCAAWLGNAKVTHCALDLRVAEQDLNGAQVTGCLVNDRVSLCRLTARTFLLQIQGPPSAVKLRICRVRNASFAAVLPLT
jgi:hypothetical protein